MLDLVVEYSYRWGYKFNASKSAVLVSGESAASRRLLRSNRTWYLGATVISESDCIKHLGIMLSVFGTSIDHTNRSLTFARSAYFSLNSVGARFGCLHPSTALRLFKAIPLSLLQCGLDVQCLSKTEINNIMLERGQLSILRVISGLPIRAPSVAIHSLLGTLPVDLLVYKAQLSLLHMILSLPDKATSKCILLSRLSNPLVKGFCKNIQETLAVLELPSVDDLIRDLPSKICWKAYVKSILHLLLNDRLLEFAVTMSSLSEVSLIPFKCDVMLCSLYLRMTFQSPDC